MKRQHEQRTPRAGRSLLRAAAGFVVVMGLGATGVHAQQPTGGEVVSGQATIATAPNLTTVTADNNSVLRWGSFDVGVNETVRFVQPGTDARVLNWIGSLTPSQIDGSLLANGHVYLLNPQGVFFGQTAVIDAGQSLMEPRRQIPRENTLALAVHARFLRVRIPALPNRGAAL